MKNKTQNNMKENLKKTNSEYIGGYRDGWRDCSSSIVKGGENKTKKTKINWRYNSLGKKRRVKYFGTCARVFHWHNGYMPW